MSVELPKQKTLDSWKAKSKWLTIENGHISSTKGFNRKSIDGSNNFQSTRIYEHEESEPHKTAKRCKEYDEAKKRGETYRLDIPTDAPIAQGFKRMRQAESEGLQKLFDVAYYVATKGRPLSDFESLIELEKLHGVSFHGRKYENRNACRDFVLSISDYFFQVDVKEKVSRANFIAILTDGTTDATITEQEVIYLLYLDPDNFVPRLSFFTVSELHQGQDAAMLKSAMVNAFTENNMEDALTKIVFFGSDGTWTNSGLKSGLITRLKEDFEWIVFVWCLSHGLELAMKDFLKTFMSPVDDSLRHLYYMYKNSSKKPSQLKSLFKSLTQIYEYETKTIKPEKSTGT